MKEMGTRPPSDIRTTPPASLSDLVRSALAAGAQPPLAAASVALGGPAALGPRSGHLTPTEALRVRAFNMFLHETENVSEIARTLNCTRQHIYGLKSRYKWVERKAAAKITDDMPVEDITARIMEAALTEVQARVLQRLRELDELCVVGNLKAILAWLGMSGLGEPVERGDTVPRTVEVYNDLSDNRQVTVVSDSAPMAPGALAPILGALEDPACYKY